MARRLALNGRSVSQGQRVANDGRLVGRHHCREVRGGEGGPALLAMLHERCAGRRLSSAVGCPPRASGTTWSTVGPSGCCPVSVMSITCPHK